MVTMMMTNARSTVAEFNWARIAVFAALFTLMLMLMIEPAFANSGAGAFTDFSGKVKARTDDAFSAGKTILYAAAGLALLIGIAPMIWGQVKVKWIVSCLCAAALFGLAPVAITAFTI